MAEAVAERVRRYILDGSDEDLRRLLGIAEISAEMARAAFRRVGVQQGWRTGLEYRPEPSRACPGPRPRQALRSPG
jgi:hypothetical protein